MQDKILVVDDEEAIRELLNNAFTLSGYKVFTADSAEEALEIVKKEVFHVYFLDIKLPGMNGIKLFKGLKRNRPSAFYFAMTGYSSVFDRPNSQEVGFNGCFFKPFDLKEVIKAAAEAFTTIHMRMKQETI